MLCRSNPPDIFCHAARLSAYAFVVLLYATRPPPAASIPL